MVQGCAYFWWHGVLKLRQDAFSPPYAVNIYIKHYGKHYYMQLFSVAFYGSGLKIEANDAAHSTVLRALTNWSKLLCERRADDVVFQKASLDVQNVCLRGQIQCKGRLAALIERFVSVGCFTRHEDMLLCFETVTFSTD